MPKSIATVGEFGLIKHIAKIVGTSSSVIKKGIGDDTAVITLSSTRYLLLTSDMLVEDVHFYSSTTPKAIGHKAMACSLSDIASMGGRPLYALVSLGLKGNELVKNIQSIYKGMQAIAKSSGVFIVGGDTVKSEKLTISVALVGEVSKKTVVYRCGAKEGDQIFITGIVGGSLESHHLNFMPRLKEGQLLAKHYHPTAMIDISDGLIADLKHILTASKVGACIYEDLIPCRSNVSLKQALSDGEDFELLFTLNRKNAKRLLASRNPILRKCQRIGEIVAGNKGLCLLSSLGQRQKMRSCGYKHFEQS